MGDASYSNCRKKQGSVSSVVGKLRSWDFVDVISVMIFIPAETLNGICSIVYESSALPCLPNLVRISRAGLHSRHKWNWSVLQFHLCLTFALFTAYDFISNL